jgi:hypothetical protein
MVAPVHRTGGSSLEQLIGELSFQETAEAINAEAWDRSAYRPVPNVIEAATSVFAGHGVRSIAQADASNLCEAASRLMELVARARMEGRRALVFLTGVPGSGKTLAGLHVVHEAVEPGTQQKGDIVYLSGNGPLVTVLREALAQDEHRRGKQARLGKRLKDIRRDVRARIQHINDFLRQSLRSPGEPPHEHAIVFDEAQRAWDERQGKKKFGRGASEPALLLELMGLHQDWCACVCLVGGGQEINAGEKGVLGWGEAIRGLKPSDAARWEVYAPTDVLQGGPSTGGLSLGELPPEVVVHEELALQLHVPMRSFRSPSVSNWVSAVIQGDPEQAAEIARNLGDYPIVLTRSLDAARQWLRHVGRGQRRYGLVTSPGARRLRADGLGSILTATDRVAIEQWYLNPMGDIRSSYALEVPVNAYTCQGLELDFVGVCWNGDFIRRSACDRWICRRLSGTAWQTIGDPIRQQFVRNWYRVLLTRAREGMVIWVPRGDPKDETRNPAFLDATAHFLKACGVRTLDTAG